MYFNKKVAFICLLAVVILTNSCSVKKRVEIKSPNESYEFVCFINDTTGNLNYSVTFLGKEIIKPSVVGFQISNNEQPHNITINGVIGNSVNSKWQPVYGEKNEYPDIYSEKIISITDNEINYKLNVRAYNEGVAFRWNFVDENLTLIDEKTEFTLPDNVVLWASENAQSEIFKLSVADIQKPIDRPLLIQSPDSLFIAIGEAGLVDFARMKFIKSPTKKSTLKAKLDGEAKFQKPFETPWRYIMAATKPSEILENNFLILNLNQPNKIEDTSWIKPGKIIREVTLTTKGGMACVDFAAKHNLQFVEFDAGWYGYEYDTESDATTITIDPKRSKGPLDLHKIIKYAESKNIGIVLYVNMRSLEKQLDEILPLFKSWGIKGVKYGFVNVGSQEWTTWLHDAVRKAADYQLMVDIHDEYRPTGYSRTYPNLMTQEGIRGDEESPDNEMVLKTIFTRMIAGAGDHTNCYFDNRVDKKLGSHASQLAKLICVYSPWQFVYWYDRPKNSDTTGDGGVGNKNQIIEVPELTFIDEVPTVWDDTKVIDGFPGEFAVIARRSGNRWFVGALNGDQPRNITIPLNFLSPESKYKATIYYDDPDVETVTKVGIEHQIVGSTDHISREIKARNGMGIILRKID